MLVVVGRIGRAHGIRGELSVEIRTDEPERRFAPGSSLRAEGRTVVIEAARRHSGRLLVRLRGVPDRTAAEALQGLVLEAEIDADELPDEDDTYYDHQLVGLRVLDHDGTEVGTVTSVLHLPVQDLLVVDADGAETMVPFVAELVPEVDLGSGTLRLADVPGLVDPASAETASAEPSRGPAQ